MMKIMFVIHALNRMGGAERILTNYANYFASKGEEVAITLLSKDDINFELHKSISIYQYTDNRFYGYVPKKIRRFIQQVKYIADSLDHYDPDIVISFVASTNILSTFSAKLAKKPVILAERSSYHKTLVTTRGKLGAIIWKALRRIIYPYADQVIVLTEEDKPKYYYAKDVRVIPNPLILQHRYTGIERENIILGVGRLHEVKGFDMLIRAFSQIHSSGWKLIIAGEGSERTSLERLINELDISDKVELAGLIDDIELYYKKASIYVLSSRSEGYPGGLCEAMGYGCASIAFDCPTGPKEIIADGEDGLLIEPNDIDKLAIAMQNLIDNKEKREELGMNARKILDRLDVETIGQQWKDSMVTTINRYKKEHQ